MRAVLLAALAGSGLLASTLSGAPAGDPRPVLEIMLDLSKRHSAAEKKLLDGQADEELRQGLTALAAIYVELKASYRPFYGGTPKSWESVCERSRGAADEAAQAAGRGDLAGARAAFFRLAKIREEAHEEFRPGFLKRIIRLFRRKPAGS